MPDIRKRTLLDFVCSVQSYYVLLFGLLPGFGLIFFSLILNVANFTALSPEYSPVDRQVGYLAAINWSFTYAILFPLLIFLMAQTLAGLSRALDKLHERKMVRTPSMSIVGGKELSNAWIQGTRTRSILLIIFAVVFPLFFAGREYYENNFLRLLGRAAVPHKSDFDWGLASLMAPTAFGAPPWSLAIFDCLAFTCEALLISTLIGFFILVLDLGRAIPSGRRGEALMLVPDFSVDDRRAGFEVFAKPMEKFLAVCLIAYLICYLVRVEGAYMANASPNIFAFVRSDILSGFGQAASALSKMDKSKLADALKPLFDVSGIQVRAALACMATFLIAIFSIVTLLMTIGSAADCAKENGSDLIKQEAIPGATAKLEKMVTWPLGYLSLNVLAMGVILAILTLIMYRIGLFMAGAVTFTLLFRAFQASIFSPKKDSKATKN